MLPYSRETRLSYRKNSGIVILMREFILSYDKDEHSLDEVNNVTIKRELTSRILDGLIKPTIINYPAESTILFSCEESIDDVYTHLFDVDGLDNSKFIVCEVAIFLPQQQKSTETIEYLKGFD